MDELPLPTVMLARSVSTTESTATQSESERTMKIQPNSAFSWTKSSYSGGNGACVEMAVPAVSAIAVRDSKDPEGPRLTFGNGSWSAFVADVSRGAYDLA
jgi:hypothetical protein